MFQDVQALLDMSQRSHNSHISILLLNTRSKGIYNSFVLIPLFTRVIYKYMAQTFMPQQLLLLKFNILLKYVSCRLIYLKVLRIYYDYA